MKRQRSTVIFGVGQVQCFLYPHVYSYDWKFGLELQTCVSVNLKPKIWRCTKQFYASSFFWRSKVHFSSHKHVKRVLRVLLILRLVPKTDVSWTASSKISMSERFTYAII